MENPFHESHFKMFGDDSQGKNGMKNLIEKQSYEKYYAALYSLVSNDPVKLVEFVRLDGELGLNYVLARLGMTYLAQDGWRVQPNGGTGVLGMGKRSM